MTTTANRRQKGPNPTLQPPTVTNRETEGCPGGEGKAEEDEDDPRSDLADGDSVLKAVGVSPGGVLQEGSGEEEDEGGAVVRVALGRAGVGGGVVVTAALVVVGAEGEGVVRVALGEGGGEIVGVVGGGEVAGGDEGECC